MKPWICWLFTLVAGSLLELAFGVDDTGAAVALILLTFGVSAVPVGLLFDEVIGRLAKDFADGRVAEDCRNGLPD